MTIELIDMDTGATMEVHGDKVSGLQFSGKPTERALRAKAMAENIAIELEHYKERKDGWSPPISEDERLERVDTLTIILEALEKLAEEKETL